VPSPCPPISPSFCWNDPPRPQTPVKFPWIVYGRKPLRVRKHVSTAIICFLITPWVFVGAIMVVRPTWFDSWMRWWRKLQNKWANHSKSASRQAFRNQTASQCELSGYATTQELWQDLQIVFINSQRAQTRCHQPRGLKIPHPRHWVRLATSPCSLRTLPERYFWELAVACRAPRLGTTLTVVTGF